jgi:SAM-dependent methyltransferase
MDWDSRTVKTYNNSAEALAKYFRGIGPRTDDIDLGFRLSRSGPNSRVVEIGCGDGRDALEIVHKATWYEGFDPSIKLLELAQIKVPSGMFVEADALTYKYPKNIDIIFAFASLLHVNKNDLARVMKKAYSSLRSGGIFYISLKERDQYTEEIKEDEYGERMFYYYNPDIIKDIAGDLFVAAHEEHQKIANTKWFTIALKKQ